MVEVSNLTHYQILVLVEKQFKILAEAGLFCGEEKKLRRVAGRNDVSRFGLSRLTIDNRMARGRSG